VNSESDQFVVDRAACDHCGLCVNDCPVRIIELDEFGFPAVSAEREAQCIGCEHCLAICPTGAVTVQGVRPENSKCVTADGLPTFEQMDRLVRSRRSVRQYRQDNVDPNLIARLLDALGHAPTGGNVRQLRFTLIENRDTLTKLRTQMHEAIVTAADRGLLPPRALFLAETVKCWRNERRDHLFRGAPHLLVVSAPPTTPCPQQDVPLTLAYFELLAQSAGLGTVWFGYLKVILEALPSLKALLNLEQDHVYYGILFGNPATKYVRTVQREGSAQLYRLSSVSISRQRESYRPHRQAGSD
jgi:ferredoxin